MNPGSRIGSYEIISAIGAGGMGEVYRAHDTKLSRDVALKILPEAFTLDGDRIARFRREAQVLAALNHPNIAAIYGFEDSGSTHALVLELVEGPTLADRITKGPLPLDETLSIAKQIAEALEAAHEQGIIHRDLKPANIKLRDDGAVKVLDFGLAKALEPTSGIRADVTNSPTITTPAMMTGIGMILGTAAYMSPEQARSRSVDKRADIWAFGCVLYEMLTGARAFGGEDVGDTLATVLKSEPNWTALPASTPPNVETALRVCLKKDPKERVRDIGDVRLALDGVFQSSIAHHDRRGPRWFRLGKVAAACLLAAALGAGAVWMTRGSTAQRVTRTVIATQAAGVIFPDVAITPDGTRVLFVGNRGTRLWVRALDSLEPVTIVNATRLVEPFVSPDGQWVGFWSDSRNLKKAPIAGGPAIGVTQVATTQPRGTTWLPDDTIVFSALNTGVGLQRVPAAGGTPTTLTQPDRNRGESEHIFPAALPGGHAVLFTILSAKGGDDAAQVAVYDLRTNTSKVVLRGGSDARYVSTGHLVYKAQESLRAVPFDLARLQVSGTGAPVVARQFRFFNNPGAGAFAVSENGTLVYADRGEQGETAGRQVVWVNREGREDVIPIPPRAYRQARVSPDESRIALFDGVQDTNLWLWDLKRPVLTPLTNSQDQNQDPIWTPDGRRLVFTSNRDGGVSNLWWQATDGSGSPERLTTSPVPQFPTDVTPDGTQVIFHQTTSTGRDVMRLALDSHKVSPLVQSARNGMVSPDGHWLAYESDSSGRFEVFVKPYSNPSAGSMQVSTMGGTRPAWAHSGRELLFNGPDGSLMRVAVDATSSTFRADVPAQLIGPGYLLSGGGDVIRAYDVSKDDQRFLMIKVPSNDLTSTPSILVVVQNWFTELQQRVPTK